jgi:hypothetical protein
MLIIYYKFNVLLQNATGLKIVHVVCYKCTFTNCLGGLDMTHGDILQTYSVKMPIIKATFI